MTYAAGDKFPKLFPWSWKFSDKQPTTEHLGDESRLEGTFNVSWIVKYLPPIKKLKYG